MADGSPPPASPARHSTASSSSTNPNTPRSATPEECEAVKKHVVEARHSPESSSSSSPGGRGHAIEPTWPRAIDETKVSAQAKWADKVLPNLLLDLHWHPTSCRAFFKLRTWIPIPSPGGSRRRDARTTIYLFIYPERIKELSLDLNPANKMFGAETIVLRFEMDRPSALVLPTAQYEPVNRAGKDVMDGLRALAAQTSFSVFAKIQHRRLALKRIQQLCAAATGHGLASLAVHASTASLYEGRGGHVIDGDDLAEPASGAPPVTDEPPPHYSGPAELPPAPRGTGKGNKRRRSSSSSPEPNEPLGRKVMQDMLDASFSMLKQHFDDRLEAHKRDIVNLLDKSEARILNTLQTELGQRCDGMQEVLEGRLHEEMAEVEDNVMRNLSEAPLQATLTFPQHPWY